MLSITHLNQNHRIGIIIKYAVTKCCLLYGNQKRKKPMFEKYIFENTYTSQLLKKKFVQTSIASQNPLQCFNPVLQPPFPYLCHLALPWYTGTSSCLGESFMKFHKTWSSVTHPRTNPFYKVIWKQFPQFYITVVTIGTRLVFFFFRLVKGIIKIIDLKANSKFCPAIMVSFTLESVKWVFIVHLISKLLVFNSGIYQ